DRGAFNTIISRNIFNSDGIIPPALNGGGSDSPQEKDADPVPSQLPLTLVGTLVHSNPEKSIAAVEVKCKGQVVSYTPNKEIEGLAVVERVERMRLILRNLSNNRLEYIEIQQEGRLSFGTAAKSEPSAGVIKKVSENEFSISRSNLQAQLSDMSTILRQA